MLNTLFFAVISLVASAGTLSATELEVPQSSFGKLDHVFLIMLENKTDTHIRNNPSAPFINAYYEIANRATNYFAIGHPSLPNYLELAGGSNFGVRDDAAPAWEKVGCVDNAVQSNDCRHPIGPIAEAGTDNAVFATASDSSETSCNGQIGIKPMETPIPNNCALRDYPASSFTPKTIADQLVAAGMSWKAYEESLPGLQESLLGVNYSDGAFSNLSPASVLNTLGLGPIQRLYAVKHNPFAYFRNIQLGANPKLSLNRIADFTGAGGLWADLRSGAAPNFSFIVPNQCHDMHADSACPARNNEEQNLLISVGDAEVRKIVNAIKSSQSWKEGRNCIILVWDENDFHNEPNRVILLVESNYAPNGRQDDSSYDHFSLLKTLEAAFGLACLNHACDSTSQVMNVMFGGH